MLFVGNSHLSVVGKETTGLEIHSEGPRRESSFKCHDLRAKRFWSELVSRTENLNMNFFTFDVLGFPMELDTKVLQESWSN